MRIINPTTGQIMIPKMNKNYLLDLINLFIPIRGNNSLILIFFCIFIIKIRKKSRDDKQIFITKKLFTIRFLIKYRDGKFHPKLIITENGL